MKGTLTWLEWKRERLGVVGWRAHGFRKIVEINAVERQQVSTAKSP